MGLIEDYLYQIQEMEPIMMAISAASLSMGAFNLYKQHLTKAARVCKSLPPKEKSLCMLTHKLRGKQIQHAKLKSNMSKCSKTKDPQKCKKSLLKKTIKVGEEIKFLSKRVQQLAKQKYK